MVSGGTIIGVAGGTIIGVAALPLGLKVLGLSAVGPVAGGAFAAA